jgi:hypothetical protein
MDYKLKSLKRVKMEDKMSAKVLKTPKFKKLNMIPLWEGFVGFINYLKY